MHKPSGPRCSRARTAAARWPGGVSAGTRRMATSSTSISCPQRALRRRCSCSSTAWRATGTATPAVHLPAQRGRWAGSWRCRISESCSGELNRRRVPTTRVTMPRSTGSCGACVSVTAGRHVVGVSLGGNALMRWAGEMGESAQDLAQAVASVCSPLDLAACGIAIDQGFKPRGLCPPLPAPWSRRRCANCNSTLASLMASACAAPPPSASLTTPSPRRCTALRGGRLLRPCLGPSASAPHPRAGLGAQCVQ